MSSTPVSTGTALALLLLAFAIGCGAFLWTGDGEQIAPQLADPALEPEERLPTTDAEDGAEATTPPRPVDAGTTRTTATGPRIRAADTRLEFGTVAVGQELQQTFVLHNDGDRDLQITKAKASCGCAALDYDKVIPAHGEGRFELRISGRSVRAGTMSHRIEIESNDPNFWLMTIRATVDPSLPAKGTVDVPDLATGR